MPIDKTIFELPEVTLDILQAAGRISFVAQIEGYDYDFEVPAEIMQEYLAGGFTFEAFGGLTNPDPAQGKVSDLYFQTNGKVYQRIIGGWKLITTVGVFQAEPIDIAVGTQLTAIGDNLFYAINYFGNYQKYGTDPQILIYRMNGDYKVRRYIEYQINSNGQLLIPIDDNDGAATTQPYKIIIKA